jgi:hypothetical protein
MDPDHRTRNGHAGAQRNNGALRVNLYATRLPR